MNPVTTNEYNHPLIQRSNSLDDVTLECEHKWHRLKSIQAQLGEVTVGMVGDLQGNSPSPADTLSLLREHKKRLEAELASLQSKGLQTLPENSEMQHLVLQQDHQENLQQWNETLAFMRARRTELMDSIATEKDNGKQLRELNTKFKERSAQVNSTILSNDNNSSIDGVLSNLKVELDKMSRMDQTYENILSKVFDNYIPANQNKENVKLTKIGLNDSMPYDTSNLCSLRSIIDKLIKQTLNSPADPYIDINDTIWPLHIESLLRYQIIQKDPENSMRIKLNSFHF